MGVGGIGSHGIGMGFPPSFFMGLGWDKIILSGTQRFENPLVTL